MNLSWFSQNRKLTNIRFFTGAVKLWPKITINVAKSPKRRHFYYPRDAICYRAISLDLCVRVCLAYVLCHNPVLYRNGCTDRTGFVIQASVDLRYTVF